MKALFMKPDQFKVTHRGENLLEARDGMRILSFHISVKGGVGSPIHFVGNFPEKIELPQVVNLTIHAWCIGGLEFAKLVFDGLAKESRNEHLWQSTHELYENRSRKPRKG